MPKKSAKKSKMTEGAENNKKLPEPEQPNIKEYISNHYSRSTGDYKWVWITAITFTVVILSLWAWLTVLQITRLSQQIKQDGLAGNLNKDLDHNFEKIRQEQSVTKQLQTAWDNIIASLPTSTTSSTVSTSTTSTTDTASTSTATTTVPTTTTIQTTTNR